MKATIQLRRFTVCFALALAPFAGARTQNAAQAPASPTDAEAWARALVDSPFQQSGDDDALVASWLVLLATEPQHPLCEVTLAMLEQAPTQDERRVRQHVLALDPKRFSPAAAAVLTRVQSSIRVATTPREDLGKWTRNHVFPGTLALASSLGPLGDPLDRAARNKLMAQPDFEREHIGLARRAVHWKNIERPLTSASIDPGDEVSPRAGWVLLAFEFDATRGGPAWIDFDLHGAIGPLVLDVLSTQERSWVNSLPDPSWSYSINDAAPVEVDYVHAERPLRERVPIVLRDGRNRVLLACNVDARLRFAVHVLGADGRPWTGLDGQGLVEARDHRELGRVVEARVPTQELVTSENFLRQLPTRGVDTEVLLGTIEAFDARPASGFARLRAAVDSAPDRNGLKAWLSGAYSFAYHLPDTWKRGRARELAEQVVVADPLRADMQIAMARILAPEDKEEDAITKLETLARATPTSADALLELNNIYPRLDLEVPAERALIEAKARAPQSSRVLGQLAKHYADIGQPTQALAYIERGVDNQVSADALINLGDAQANLGQADAALATYRSAALIGDASERARLAHHLTVLERFDEADAVWAELEKRFEAAPVYAFKRADIERARGNDKAELAHLHEALRREPSSPAARERVLAMTGHEAAHDTLQRLALDVDGTLATFVADKWNDSVVRVIDAAVLYVFDDGAFEQVSHERSLVRDLQGCESEGTQHPSGEVLKIATIKAQDGKEYEPTEVDNEFVMPSLQPGDSIEIITKNFRGAPEDGVVRLPGWSFAAVDQPFHLSRYVVSLPKTLALRMVLRNFAGEHKTIDEGERVVHIFETRDLPRVLLEPGSPPPEWILPSVEFAMDSKREEIAQQLTQEAALAVRVTPEIRAAAAKATEGMTSEEDKARVLHSFVTHALDKRAPLGRTSALSALLSRQGNATFLYAALLEAAGIERDIVWSRDYAPGCDPEPEPSVLTPERWMRHLYLLVKPKDGAEAWCDMAQRTRGYGTPIEDAPKASAFSTASGKWFEMPDCPLAERAGERHKVEIKLDGGRAAEVELTLDLTGNQGQAIKERMRETPTAKRKQVCTNIATSIVPGCDVTSFDMPGVDADGGPMSFYAKGNVKSFLDEAGGELACKLPMPPLSLSNLASGEGTRKHPFFLPSAVAMHSSVHFVLPDGWKLAQPFTDVREEFHGCSYSLVFEADGEHAFTLRRELLIPPLLLQPAEYPQLVALAKRVDEAERTRLRFTKPEAK